MRWFLLILGCAAPCLGAGVRVLFDPASRQVGPFPSDRLTVADPAQKTGVRVNLPECAEPCPEVALLNELDGFHVLARVNARFSAAVNLDTLRDGIKLVALDNLTQEEYGLKRPGDVIPINQVVYDPKTNTAYAKPDTVLDQHRRYLLVVTGAVRDTAGAPVEEDPAFRSCLERGEGGYCAALAQAVERAAPAVAPARVVAASLFTTMSATSWLERARAALSSAPIGFERTGGRNVFALSDLSSVVLRRQIGVNPSKFDEVGYPVGLLSGIGALAFASIQSPQFLTDDQTIAAPPTLRAIELPARSARLYFHAFLPSQAKPAAGYPVVIFGHGFTDSRFGGPSAVASTLAGAGFAVLGINAVGHGNGPEGRLVLRTNAGVTTEMPTGGRGIDRNGDGTIDDNEGCLILDAARPVGLRDCLQQTVVDLMQLTRALRTGLDLDGDGARDLDPDRIYYAGQSLGAIYGTVFSALEPGVSKAVLNVGGGSIVDIVRWGRSYREYALQFLAARGLLNSGKDFDEQYVLRWRSVQIVDAPGAIEVQSFLESLEWLHAAGDPLSYAPHLVSSTLPGVPIKQVLWQFAKGDRTVPNPASSALIRAANMRESAWMYRHDLARRVFPGLPEDPHTYLVNILSLPAIPVALAAQAHMTNFFLLEPGSVPDPNAGVRALLGVNLFEIPDLLPEELNY